jgi:hypothetical protein
MDICGYRGGHPRAPIAPVSAEGVERLRKLLEQSAAIREISEIRGS